MGSGIRRALAFFGIMSFATGCDEDRGQKEEEGRGLEVAGGHAGGSAEDTWGLDGKVNPKPFFFHIGNQFSRQSKRNFRFSERL